MQVINGGMNTITRQERAIHMQRAPAKENQGGIHMLIGR